MCDMGIPHRLLQEQPRSPTSERLYCVSEEKRTGFKISSNGAMHVPRFTVTVRHSKEMNPGLKLEHMFIRSQKLQVRIRCVYHEINTCEPQ